jgi:hypothetical protein
VVSMCALTWSKLTWESKLQKRQYLGGSFVFYFVRGPKSQLLET